MSKLNNSWHAFALGGGLAAAMAATSLAGHAQDKTAQTTTVAKPISATALTHLNATSASTSATASSTASPGAAKPAAVNPAVVAASNFYKPNYHPGAILLRKPNAPAGVQWAAARQQSVKMQASRTINSLAARLPKAELDRTRLPVILPHVGAAIDTAKSKMISFGDAYALNMPQAKGTQITMYGNRSFVPTDKGMISKRPFAKLTGMAEDVRIEQTEDGWTATFTRYGVVYSLDVSCDDTASPDCQTDAYIRQAITQFDDVTMGAQASAEADNSTRPLPHSKPPASWLDQVTQSIKNIGGGK